MSPHLNHQCHETYFRLCPQPRLPPRTAGAHRSPVRRETGVSPHRRHPCPPQDGHSELMANFPFHRTARARNRKRVLHLLRRRPHLYAQLHMGGLTDCHPRSRRLGRRRALRGSELGRKRGATFRSPVLAACVQWNAVHRCLPTVLRRASQQFRHVGLCDRPPRLTTQPQHIRRLSLFFHPARIWLFRRHARKQRPPGTSGTDVQKVASPLRVTGQSKDKLSQASSHA